jgi:hypothetical protein
MPLEPKLVEYLEQYASTLQIEYSEPPVDSGDVDYSSATMLLPTRLFGFTDQRHIQVPKCTGIDRPIWGNIATQYRSGSTDTVILPGGNAVISLPAKELEENKKIGFRWVRIPVRAAAWLPRFEEIAADLAVAEIWRLVASFPEECFWGRFGEVYGIEDKQTLRVGDIAFSVIGSIDGKAVVSIALDYRWKFLGHGMRHIPSEALAQAMCGGRVLPPDNDTLKYGSRAEGWELIPVPEVLAFCTISAADRCYISASFTWVAKRIRCMLKVSHYLWNHADAVDCNAEGVPIKVILQSTTDTMARQNFRGNPTMHIQDM